MNKFKEGQYVKYRFEDVCLIYRVYGYSNEKIVMLEKSVQGAHFTVEAHEDALCLALNIDYIRTLPAEQVAKIIFGIYDHCVYGRRATGHPCRHNGKCIDGIEKLLQKPYDGWRV